MVDLVPIKVKIGVGPVNGKQLHKYPSFNTLQSIIDSGMDWSEYVDVRGLGWHYDKTSGHDTDSTDSPIGNQNGVLIVPKIFADEAVVAFPTVVSKLNETDLEDFYDNKAHAHESDNIVNEHLFKEFEMKTKLGVPLSGTENILRNKMLDPADDTLGITKNNKKKWSDFKQISNVTIVQ